MPRKSIPPSEPLPADLQERLEVFKKYTVEHAMLIRKDDELTQRIWEPGGFAFLLLSGPTGVGKSELLRVVTHRMQTRAQVVTLGERIPSFKEHCLRFSNRHVGPFLVARQRRQSCNC